MRTPRSRELGWVHRNRQPVERTELISTALPRVVDARLAQRTEHREAVRDCIDRMVDEGFRALCTLGKVDDRSVEILVNHPTAVAALRLQWLFDLLERLDRLCGFKASPRIRFCLGTGGDAFLGRGDVAEDFENHNSIQRPRSGDRARDDT